jgi:hypothetical protein
MMRRAAYRSNTVPHDHARVKQNVLYNEQAALPGRPDANVRDGHAPPPPSPELMDPDIERSTSDVGWASNADHEQSRSGQQPRREGFAYARPSRSASSILPGCGRRTTWLNCIQPSHCLCQRVGLLRVETQRHEAGEGRDGADRS